MPDITIIKLKIRRGTDNQRRTIVLEQGELGYSTDTRRVFVGDGITIGGVPVSNVNHAPIFDYSALIAQRNAVINDFVFAGTYLYQLTATDYSSLSSWARISNNLLADDVSIGYTTVNGVDSLRIKDGGITGSMFNASAAYNQGGLSATNNGLLANVDNSTLTITNSNQLSVYKIDHRHMSRDSFTLGVTGGEGEQIQLYTDPTFFSFNLDNSLTLNNIPDQSVTFPKLDIDPNTGILGPGLFHANNQIVTTVQGVAPGGGLEDDGYNQIRIQEITPSGDSYFKTLEFNRRGQIINSSRSITSTLSCDTSMPSLSIFNGSSNQSIYTNQTIFTVLSSNGDEIPATAQLVLSSAGFIMFDQTFDKDEKPIGRFAIPIFNY